MRFHFQFINMYTSEIGKHIFSYALPCLYETELNVIQMRKVNEIIIIIHSESISFFIYHFILSHFPE